VFGDGINATLTLPQSVYVRTKEPSNSKERSKLEPCRRNVRGGGTENRSKAMSIRDGSEVNSNKTVTSAINGVEDSIDDQSTGRASNALNGHFVMGLYMQLKNAETSAANVMLAGGPPESTWEKQRDKDLQQDHRGTWEKQKAKGSVNEQVRCKDLGGEKYDSSTVSTLSCKDK
jgi:hypothetical protein